MISCLFNIGNALFPSPESAVLLSATQWPSILSNKKKFLDFAIRPWAFLLRTDQGTHIVARTSSVMA